MNQLYVYQNGQQLGPWDEGEIRRQLASGRLTREDLVWQEGWPEWMSVHSIPALVSPPPLPPPLPKPKHTVRIDIDDQKPLLQAGKPAPPPLPRMTGEVKGISAVGDAKPSPLKNWIGYGAVSLMFVIGMILFISPSEERIRTGYITQPNVVLYYEKNTIDEYSEYSYSLFSKNVAPNLRVLQAAAAQTARGDRTGIIAEQAYKIVTDYSKQGFERIDNEANQYFLAQGKIRMIPQGASVRVGETVSAYLRLPMGSRELMKYCAVSYVDEDHKEITGYVAEDSIGEKPITPQP